MGFALSNWPHFNSVYVLGVFTVFSATVANFRMMEGQKKATDEKKDYKQIGDWESGSPDCPAKPSTYNAFKMHQSSGCDPKKE